MATTRAFRSGLEQVVSIPSEIAFADGQELTIERHGDVVTIAPRDDKLRRVLESFLAEPPLAPSGSIERTELPERRRL